jgi:hypothetical protein
MPRPCPRLFPPRPSGGASLRSRRSPASRPTSRGGRSGRPYQAVRIKRVHPSPNPSHEQTRESGEDGSRGCAASAPPSRPTAAANTRSKKSSSLVACRSSCGSAVVRDATGRFELNVPPAPQVSSGSWPTVSEVVSVSSASGGVRAAVVTYVRLRLRIRAGRRPPRHDPVHRRCRTASHRCQTTSSRRPTRPRR